MSNIIKAFLVLGIASVMVFYTMGAAYIEKTHSDRIKTLEGEMRIYDIRGQQLQKQAVEAESIRMYLMAELLMEQKDSDPAAEGNDPPPQPANTIGKASSPLVTQTWQNVTTIVKPQPIVTDNTSNNLAAQIMKIAQARGKTSSTSSQSSGSSSTRVTRAS
jgi:hypothetical protein